jgi:hypothetical protein
LRGSSRNGSFTLVVKQALQRGRRAIDGHRELLAQNRDRHVDSLDAAQNIGHQITTFEARGILAIGRFVVCSAVNVVENRARQTPFSERLEILKIVTVLQAHVASKPYAYISHILRPDQRPRCEYDWCPSG